MIFISISELFGGRFRDRGGESYFFWFYDLYKFIFL